MSATRTTCLHHLTSGGWVNDQAAPAGPVETRLYEPAPDHRPRRRITYTLSWADPTRQADECRILRDRFRRPEAGVPAEIADVSREEPE